MSNTKTVMSQAANTQGIPLDITDVFSTYLYTGDSTNPSPKVNGIDLAGEGGMVWLKSRTGAYNHYVADTEQPLSSNGGATWLHTNTTDAAVGSTGTGLMTFSSDGFSTFPTGVGVNASGSDYASWTFRKAPKFFDVVTYTGNGSADWDTRQISHNLGSTPGFIIIKRTDASDDWWCAARKSSTQYAISPNGATNAFGINTTNSAGAGSISSCATGSVFMPGFIAQTSDANVNNATYVAYLFAHNDGDGGFGPNADQDIIKCGSYIGTASEVATIDLGFEAQWVLIKRADSTSDWYMADMMRGAPEMGDTQPVSSSFSTQRLRANTSAAESADPLVCPTPNGFKFNNQWGASTWVYIAIRRGPLAPPESGTEVFAIDTRTGTPPSFTSGFPVDMSLFKAASATGSWDIGARLTQEGRLQTDTTGAELNSGAFLFDYMDGYFESTASSSTQYSWMWKRAPSFFDVVCTTGGTTPFTRSHNLGAAPEMIISKGRSTTFNWEVWHKDLSAGNGLKLNLTSAESISSVMGSVDPTDTTFDLGTTHSYVSYLFATLAGVSKVGSYTGNGSSQTIDCGFTSGARFILIKRTDSTGDWYIWDTARGIVAGNDPHLSLNTTAAEVTSDDSVDPDNSGFIVNQLAATNINVTSASYIFYAIA